MYTVEVNLNTHMGVKNKTDLLSNIKNKQT